MEKFSDELPDTLTIHVPCYENDALVCKKETVELNYEQDRILYRQLINWVATERYWQYVLNRPQTPHDVVDDISDYVCDMERDDSSLFNPYSPSCVSYDLNDTVYPQSIRSLFMKTKKTKNESEENGK